MMKKQILNYIEEHFDKINDLNTLTETNEELLSRLIDGYTLEAVGLQEGRYKR